ncbi:MAG: glycoside hydrolase family 36 protein [Candidatus Latescibacterota bacterium]
MGRFITVCENGLHIVFETDESGDVHLLHFSSLPCQESSIGDAGSREVFRMVELQVTGEDQDEHHGVKHVGTMPAKVLKYVSHRDYRNDEGRKLEITTEADGLSVTNHYQLFDAIPVVRSWVEVVNIGSESRGIEYISSFALTGIAKEGSQGWETKSRVHIPHNTWSGEAQWRASRLPDLGFSKVAPLSLKRIAYGSTGAWSSSEYLPMGCFENTECGTTLFWQIEHNGSWHCELSEVREQLSLQLSGPTENENHWWKSLGSGERFVSVPAAVGVVSGGFEHAMREITRYRRATRRPEQKEGVLPVIFNDYMYCLWADPTAEKEVPIIDAAAQSGCEYYCIDAGWYAEGTWWNSVGEWLPSARRFPEGIRAMLDYIRSKGMVPGLWLEIEAMGVACPVAQKVPDSWFFVRHGKRVVDHGKHLLDFRNPEVVAFADEVIDRVVNEYGAGFIKIDSTVSGGPGTEVNADSFGDGLLGHNRAYLAWLDGVFGRYPGLLVEHCSSGSMGGDYAMLSRLSLHSITDQIDYRKMAILAASCPTALTPEQSGIWCYPRKEADREEVVFNMVNGMLGRVYMSGAITDLSPECFSLVGEGIRYYKSIRSCISQGLPFWPLGLPSFSDEWTSLGLTCGAKLFLSVWRLDSEGDTCELPLRLADSGTLSVSCAYPSYTGCEYGWDPQAGILKVTIPQKHGARFFEISS